MIMDDVLMLSPELSVHEGNLELTLLLSLKTYLKGTHASCALSTVSFHEAKASVLKVGAPRLLHIKFFHK